LALAPLFDTYDPVTVAAALASARLTTVPESPATSQMPTWVRLHANVGRSDKVTTGDIVGAILNSVGIAKRQVGKVELREKFSLIEVRAEVAQEVLRGLDGLSLKGKKVTARIDRR
jgi:ATP-dependent RNA helicase DeaD